MALTSAASSAWSWSASAARAWMRWAVARSAQTVAWWASDLVGREPSPAQSSIWVAVLRPRSSARSSWGALTISASGLADGGHPGRGRAAAGGQQHAQRLPLTPTPWGCEVVLAKRLAGGPDRVQGVALGAAAAGWPLGPADLNDPLVVLLHELGKAGAVAARALDRPA